MDGLETLFRKEVLRFAKVGLQTVMAPVITALLYLLIFGHVLRDQPDIYAQINYVSFLVPGLVMMSVLQNSFANTSSSLIQSKVTGNIIFVLLPPITPFAFFLAYILAAVVRGITVGLGVFLVTLPFIPIAIHNPWWILLFAILGSATLGAFGMIAGIWAEKFDQIAAFQNFVILPLTFLSGVFYSVHTLPSFWQRISHFNPFFYMIDGFRYGFFGQADVSIGISLTVVCIALVVVSAHALYLIKTGYKLRG